MRGFIVHAHPEPQSFDRALTRTAVTTLDSASANAWADGRINCPGAGGCGGCAR